MSRLVSAADLAADFGITVEKLHDLRLTKGWPCVKLGRFDVRFTPDQVEQIIAMQSVTKAATQPRPAVPGQTSRSARRSA